MLYKLMGWRRGVSKILLFLMKEWSRNRAVAPESIIAAVPVLQFLPCILTCTRKWDELGFVSRVVFMVQEDTVS